MRGCVLTSVEDGDIVPSVIDLFASANWAEREVWDMFAFSQAILTFGVC